MHVEVQSFICLCSQSWTFHDTITTRLWLQPIFFYTSFPCFPSSPTPNPWITSLNSHACWVTSLSYNFSSNKFHDTTTNGLWLQPIFFCTSFPCFLSSPTPNAWIKSLNSHACWVTSLSYHFSSNKFDGENLSQASSDLRVLKNQLAIEHSLGIKKKWLWKPFCEQSNKSYLKNRLLVVKP